MAEQDPQYSCYIRVAKILFGNYQPVTAVRIAATPMW